MHHARPLPAFLVDGHRAWRTALGEGERARLAHLAADGQAPLAMVVACCDSRVMANDIFGAGAGVMFVHRNIANLVPQFSPDGAQRATSATLEYAVDTLGVRHLIVLGHSHCGGVEGCLDLHTGGPRAPAANGFVASWLEILAPCAAEVAARGLPRSETLRALEHEAILLSLKNLASFPFVQTAVAAGTLELHGIWADIGAAALEYYDTATRSFRTV